MEFRQKITDYSLRYYKSVTIVMVVAALARRARPKSTDRVNDNLFWEMGANIFFGDYPNTFFGQFQNNTNIYAALRYSF
jgi:hypothetical protein